MKPLYTIEQFKSTKGCDKLPFECYQCSKTFFTSKNQVKSYLSRKLDKNKYCSHECAFAARVKIVDVPCDYCSIKFFKQYHQIKRTNKNFCSMSCAAYYRNKNKVTGNSRSKLEYWLQSQLDALYPHIDIQYNKVNAIGSELDIYIPSMKLAFELNGIFHYQPIFGEDRLFKVQANDVNKHKACLENKIDLCTIDTSQQKKFKESTSKKYLDIITNILNQRTI